MADLFRYYRRGCLFTNPHDQKSDIARPELEQYDLFDALLNVSSVAVATGEALTRTLRNQWQFMRSFFPDFIRFAGTVPKAHGCLQRSVFRCEGSSHVGKRREPVFSVDRLGTDSRSSTNVC